MLNDAGLVISHPTHDATGPELGVKYYRDYPQDYFLSALPFPQRGDTPELEFGVTLDENQPVGIVVNGSFVPLQQNIFQDRDLFMSNLSSADGLSAGYDTISGNVNIGGIHSQGVPASPAGTQSSYSLPLVTQINEALAHSTITLNQIRELSAQQAILEKMAKTDGTYAEFGLTFFGRVSKSAMDFRPLYIGGTFQSIAFTEVLQTVPTEEAPLGAYAGHGISYQGNGYIGRCIVTGKQIGRAHV